MVLRCLVGVKSVLEEGVCLPGIYLTPGGMPPDKKWLAGIASNGTIYNISEF